MTRQSKLMLCIALVCLAPLQLGAGGQNQSSMLAYDTCGAVLTEESWQIQCHVNGWILTPGVNPAWSPDGQRIALSTSGLTIYYLADGTTTVFPGTEGAGDIRWSPDNASIAFANGGELFVIQADGSGLTRLTENVGFRGGYAWSPDGTTIAFAASVDGVPELFLMQPDGSNKIRLTYNAGFDTNPRYGYRSVPSWSPDGARIAFDCANDICTINADGSNLTRLTFDPVSAFGAVFSPVDGSIAFTTRRFGGSEVAILEESGLVTRLAPGHTGSDQAGTQHAWSVDGQRLAFVEIRPDPPSCINQDNRCVPGQNDMVYTVNRDGTGLQEAGTGHHPSWGASSPGQPVATFTYTCIGIACQFNATGSSDPDGNITSYAWDFGDSTTGAGATASHHYATGKSYIVTLTITDNSGAIGVSTRNVTANAPPVASFLVTCSGPTCTFDASTSSDSDGTIAGFSWNFGDNSYLQTSSATSTHVYGSGTFLPTLQVVDNGGLTSSASATVIVAPPPPPPPPPIIPELHVGNLSGSSTSTQKTWNALVTVQIHGATHQVLGGVTVNGRWSDGTMATCLTNAGGSCVLSRTGLLTKTNSITLTVTGAALATYVYTPAANHDVDGGSNGTTIVVKRR